MWEYLARNFKANVNILVILNFESTETGAVTLRILYWDHFNQNGMDFVIEISFCKTPVVDEKRLLLEVESQLGKSFKVSV